MANEPIVIRTKNPEPIVIRIQKPEPIVTQTSPIVDLVVRIIGDVPISINHDKD